MGAGPSRISTSWKGGGLAWYCGKGAWGSGVAAGETGEPPLGVRIGAWPVGLEPRQWRNPVTARVYVDRVASLDTARVARVMKGRSVGFGAARKGKETHKFSRKKI